MSIASRSPAASMASSSSARLVTSPPSYARIEQDGAPDPRHEW
jgi:hypothetical protein